VPKPPWLSFEEAACLPVAWTTAYRMLFTQARITAGDRVLVQGAGGGVASAAISLAPPRVPWCTRPAAASPSGREAIKWGAFEAVAAGERLPEKVDVVIETVGEATWSHSLRALRLIEQDLLHRARAEDVLHWQHYHRPISAETLTIATIATVGPSSDTAGTSGVLPAQRYPRRGQRRPPRLPL
jgi:threonine dehydrogenase-like Zn-dependent dehydrogenase